MKHCIKCGTALNQDFEFCPGCGNRLIKNQREAEAFAVDKANTPEPKSNWINIMLILIVFVLLYSIFSPTIFRDGKTDNTSNVQMQLPQEQEQLNVGNGCSIWNVVNDIELLNATFDTSTNEMKVKLQNTRDTEVDIVRVAITYELKPDRSGETELIPLDYTMSPGKTFNLRFQMKKEPYLVGVEFEGCEKIKFTEWKMI